MSKQVLLMFDEKAIDKVRASDVASLLLDTAKPKGEQYTSGDLLRLLNQAWTTGFARAVDGVSKQVMELTGEPDPG